MKKKLKVLYIEMPEKEHRYVKQAAVSCGDTLREFVLKAIAIYMANKEKNNELK